MRAAIRLTGGREVCFVCTVDDDGIIRTARVVSRGDAESVIALPGFTAVGGLTEAERSALGAAEATSTATASAAAATSAPTAASAPKRRA